eukprot:11170197-Lingulodinium_polyedra.AAC.1
MVQVKRPLQLVHNAVANVGNERLFRGAPNAMKLSIGNIVHCRAYRDTLERNGHSSAKFAATAAQMSGIFGHLTT